MALLRRCTPAGKTKQNREQRQRLGEKRCRGENRERQAYLGEFYKKGTSREKCLRSAFSRCVKDSVGKRSSRSGNPDARHVRVHWRMVLGQTQIHNAADALIEVALLRKGHTNPLD